MLILAGTYLRRGMNPLVHTLGYNLTYILPEMLVTVLILYIPAVYQAVGQVKRQACA